jgi:hypothetical protein
MIISKARQAVLDKLRQQGSAACLALALWWAWDATHGKFTLVSYLIGLSFIIARYLWHRYTQYRPWFFLQTQLLFFFFHSMLHILALWVSYLIQHWSN